jgi:outer membrane protein assembly factor BamD
MGIKASSAISAACTIRSVIDSVRLAGGRPVVRMSQLVALMRWAVVVLLLAGSAGCAARGRNNIPEGTREPDRFLFERGSAELKEEHWITAREFFRQLTETYTQSPFRQEAKLGTGDTYLGEGTAEALVMAINEFREFLAFYPTHPRADYAQYRLAMANFKQMRGAQRDQTETKAAIAEFEAFVTKYPSSTLLPEVQAKLREARDRIGQYEYEVGRFYYRQRWYPGAIDRLQALLKQDPGFTHRDAVYYYLGESLIKVNRQAEALPYFGRLVEEFEKSEFLEEAHARVAELKAEVRAR